MSKKCQFCDYLEFYLDKRCGITDYCEVNLDEMQDKMIFRKGLEVYSGHDTLPCVFIGGKLVGGLSDLGLFNGTGELKEFLDESGVKNHKCKEYNPVFE